MVPLSLEWPLTPILMFLKYIFATFLVNKNVDNSKVPVSKLCTWNVGRTLVLLLEWCDRTPRFSGLSPVRRVISLIASTSRAHTAVWRFYSTFTNVLFIFVTFVTFLKFLNFKMNVFTSMVSMLSSNVNSYVSCCNPPQAYRHDIRYDNFNGPSRSMWSLAWRRHRYQRHRHEHR